MILFGVFGSIVWINILEGFGTKVVWIMMLIYLGILVGAIKEILTRKNEDVKKMKKYLTSKLSILQNTIDLFIELHEYNHTRGIDPQQTESISRKILSYAKSMRAAYESYQEISIQTADLSSENRGYGIIMHSILESEKNMFQEIMKGFNMIFDFWIGMHIRKIESYKDHIEEIQADNNIQNNELTLAMTRMDTNIKIFEKIQIHNH